MREVDYRRSYGTCSPTPMTGRQRVTADKLSQAEALFQSGKKAWEVAQAIGVTSRTARRYGSALRAAGRISNEVDKGGRRLLIAPRVLRSIRREALHGSLWTMPDCQRHLRDTYSILASRQTVRRSLRRCNIISCKRRKRALLKPSHRRARLQFARDHRHWRAPEWGQVLWSDESRINIDGPDGAGYCLRERGAELTDRDVQGVVKHGGGGIMIWGCISSEGVGKVCPLEGHVNTDKYLQVCGPNILRSIWARWGLEHHKCIFQQDNASCHVSKKAIDWFKRERMELMKWPAQSPDLNPIEHLWADLKKRVYKRPRPPNLAVHWQNIYEEWCLTPPETCRALVESMPRRMEAVIRASGGYTKY